jgi:hypothetical protein
MALVSVIFITLFLFVLAFCYILFFKSSSKLMVFAVLFIMVFLLLMGFTYYDSLIELEKVKDYSKLGPFGDYIGGVLNPLISVFAVFAAGFAFYAQYQANKQVQDQFKIQQLESQFYERLNLVKEEINTIYLPLMKGDTLLGRKVFYELDKEIKLIFFLVNNLLSIDDLKIKFEITYYIFYKGRIKYFKNINHFRTKYNLELNELLEIELFLSAIYEYLKINHEDNIDVAVEVILDNLLDVLNEGGRLDDFLDVNNNYHYAYLILKSNENINLNHLPFKGMETKLSLILRQLFSLVKFVTNPKTITYEEKRNYLRVLRSILSNYEQLHIFYNWYSSTGAAWEDDKNKFLTNYRMIHNLPPDFLIDGFNLETIFSDRNFRYEENRKLQDSLFEQIDIFSTKL